MVLKRNTKNKSQKYFATVRYKKIMYLNIPHIFGIKNDRREWNENVC